MISKLPLKVGDWFTLRFGLTQISTPATVKSSCMASPAICGPSADSSRLGVQLPLIGQLWSPTTMEKDIEEQQQEELMAQQKNTSENLRQSYFQTV